MAQLWQLTATELADLVRSHKISAREAVQAALDRLDDVNGAINAVVEHRPAHALAAADAIDARLRDGGEVGALAGVPVTVKVNVDQAGYATTEGVTLQRDHVAATNNPVVDNLLKAGAVIIGRTNMPAFALRWFTSNRLYGETRNPRDSRLTPGGSSGGAGAAVTAGIGAIAHGTDIAGSIRYPAYACGVHGLRPTLGRVPFFNSSLPERTIGGQIGQVSGPLARSIADLRLAVAAMAARDVRDPWWAPAPLVGPPAPKRAAICVAPDGLETHPQVAQAVRDAGTRLQAMGWQVPGDSNTPTRRGWRPSWSGRHPSSCARFSTPAACTHIWWAATNRCLSPGTQTMAVTRLCEPPRDVRRLHFLGGLESCQVVRRGGIRRSCGSGRCGWSLRSAISTIRSGRRSVRSLVCSGLVVPRRCANGCARPRSMPAQDRARQARSLLS
jgi:Asp-tRNA(Asn)/Glu-tRNA(Gln) amidotransferase A subunit family amidase